jgi:hypothetical protein
MTDTEMERILEEGICAPTEVLSQYFPEGTDENYKKKLSGKLVGQPRFE